MKMIEEVAIIGEIVNLNQTEMLDILRNNLRLTNLELIENGNVIDYEGDKFCLSIEPLHQIDIGTDDIVPFHMTARFYGELEDCKSFICKIGKAIRGSGGTCNFDYQVENTNGVVLSEEFNLRFSNINVKKQMQLLELYRELRCFFKKKDSRRYASQGILCIEY